MNGEEWILAFDTSNYRTSVCLINTKGELIGERRDLLDVEQGERGLQQSAALFQHVKQLAPQMESIFSTAFSRAPHASPSSKIVAVAASTAPRPVEGSYMPVFLAGEMLARSIAAVLQVPFYRTTHQEGHIAAGEHTAPDKPENNRFLAVHLSGGTSELLLCDRTEDGYHIEKIGGSRDLHAGQLIDRVGVALGLPFPAGPHLEKLASRLSGQKSESSQEPVRVPSSINGLFFHLSGPETALLRMIEQKQTDPAQIARAAEAVIANSLAKILRKAVAEGYPCEILVVGGVAANRYIQERLRERLEHPAVGCRLYFCPPAYSGDNAYGVAMIGLKQWLNQPKNEH